MKIVIALFVLISVAFVTLNGQTPKKTAATADVKIRQRMSMGSTPGTETTLYIKGARMRNEMAGGGAGFTSILQCDLKRTITVNEKTKSYMVNPTNAPGTNAAEGDGGGAAPTATKPAQTPAQRRGGVVDVVHTITDTGERKEMFGFNARHIKTSIVKKASPDACDKDQKIETDGWYIDFQYAFECPGEKQKPDPMPVRPQRPGCQDEVRTKTIGTAKLGFPLLVTTTIYQPDGRTNSMTQEVLELSRAPLDAALFDVPAGYTLAKDMQELYGMGASSTYAGSSAPSNTAGGSSNTGSSSPAANTANAAGVANPKKPGVIRVGLLQPSVQLNSGDAASAAEALRNGFANHLKDANVEVVLLSARSASSALNEARQAECNYILSSSLTVKKGGGSMFGRAIGNIAGAATGIPVGSATGAAIKAKDEVTLAYKLEPLIQGKQSLSNTEKAKASRDGEDVVGPLVQNASKTIKTAVAQN
ncbi:MAG: DUF4412 domain-containing protein [Acidobacteria bacterium]|nr:DUF4412 domain-containing protein [Acidobacteriota bacterium]